MERKFQTQMASLVNFKKSNNSSRLFQKFEEGTLNSFCEANITLIPKPYNTITRKENHMLRSHRNIDNKILNLAKQSSKMLKDHKSKIYLRNAKLAYDPQLM